MGISKLSLFRTSLFHFYKSNHKPPSSFLSSSGLCWTSSLRVPYSSLSSFQCTKALPFRSDAASAATNDAPTHDSVSQPWPEWVSFLDGLKSKGYLDGEAYSQEDSAAGASTADADFNRVKTACMSFARERFDILKSLSREDIQALVKYGCPNLHRKAVNSAKRLRAYVRLDEGEVCSTCNLRGSCDRAYIIAKEDEGARTVDVVRVLLSYATDVADAERSNAKKNVEKPARKLLSQLIELSNVPIDPSLQVPALKLSSQREKEAKTTDRENKFPDADMKRGDWICAECNFINFARNLRCLQCNKDGPRRTSSDETEMKKGDWTCSKCNFMNFAKNIRCLRCREEGPARTGDEKEMKKGDWTCPGCQFMNFARNSTCFRCQHARPKRQLLPGEWECPSCDFLNYRRNMKCLKCNCDRPKDSVDLYEDQTWGKPMAGNRRRDSYTRSDEDRYDDEFRPVQRAGRQP